MTKVEFIARHVSPEGAKFDPPAGFLKITHACGCILTQTAGHPDYAELCGRHTREYCSLKEEESHEKATD